MKLSIITINYNNLAGLKRTIESVLAQCWTDFEWIIIDGGSTDGSRELIEENASHFAYWCSERDKGIYNAMNKGVLKAKGEYLNFLNSGDTYCESETLARIFSQPLTTDVVYGDTRVRDEKGEITGLWVAPPRIAIVDYLNGFCIPHQSSLIRRGCMLSHLYDESFRIFADMEFFAYVVSHGGTFEKLNMPIAVFEAGGISGKHLRLGRVEEKRAKLVGMKHLLPKWFNVIYWMIPNIPIRPKWALVRLLCAVAIRNQPAKLKLN